MACGDYSGTTQARYVEVLEFTHFVTMFEFAGDGHFRGNKRLIQKMNCSVVYIQLKIDQKANAAITNETRGGLPFAVEVPQCSDKS